MTFSNCSKKLKPKLVKDLGRISNHRYGEYECPKCESIFKRRVSSVEKNKIYKCKECLGNPRRTHGETGTRIYKVWTAMRDRCLRKNVKSYVNYGGRGITICDDWLKSYVSFRDWALTNGYNKDLTIDRINNNGNYEPSNCRFITRLDQAYNRRPSKKVSNTGEIGITKSYSIYIARIMYKRKEIFCKSFKTLNDAVMARDKFITMNNLPHKLSFENKKL